MWKTALITVLVAGLILGNSLVINKPSDANMTILNIVQEGRGDFVFDLSTGQFFFRPHTFAIITLKNLGHFGRCNLQILDEKGKVVKSFWDISINSNFGATIEYDISKMSYFTVEVYSLQGKEWVKTDEQTISDTKRLPYKNMAR